MSNKNKKIKTFKNMNLGDCELYADDVITIIVSSFYPARSNRYNRALQLYTSKENFILKKGQKNYIEKKSDVWFNYCDLYENSLNVE